VFYDWLEPKNPPRKCAQEKDEIYKGRARKPTRNRGERWRLRAKASWLWQKTGESAKKKTRQRKREIADRRRGGYFPGENARAESTQRTRGPPPENGWRGGRVISTKKKVCSFLKSSKKGAERKGFLRRELSLYLWPPG